MNYVLDKRVAFAIENIWVNIHSGKGREAFEKLQEAAADNVADAYYFLGRCYSGSSFVNPIFGFPVDDDYSNEYLNKAILLGSPFGMFAGMRVGGYEPPNGTFVHPPYNSLREVWDVIDGMAREGNLFCLYLIGNAYYYNDVIKFFDIDLNSITDVKEIIKLDYEWALHAATLFELCLKQGMVSAAPNLINMYNSGESGIGKQPEKAKELEFMAANMGHGFYEGKVATYYYENNQFAQADELFKRSLAHGYTAFVYDLGKMYTFRGEMTRDLNYARQCFETDLKEEGDVIGSNNHLGEIYFYGGDGIEPDFDKAFTHLSAAHNAGNNWGCDMLGTCYLKGLGTPVNYQMAQEIFSYYPYKVLCAIGLGEIFAYGLGTTPDIKTGMKYWNQYPNDPRIIAHKSNFKRTLSGWKRIN